MTCRGVATNGECRKNHRMVTILRIWTSISQTRVFVMHKSSDIILSTISQQIFLWLFKQVFIVLLFPMNCSLANVNEIRTRNSSTQFYDRAWRQPFELSVKTAITAAIMTQCFRWVSNFFSPAVWNHTSTHTHIRLRLYSLFRDKILATTQTNFLRLNR